jgi:cyclopropane-fatty-acyl-phospholipid synthase
MLIQAITISDQRFNSAKKDVDFIKRYIFPGSCIPSINAISHSLTKSSDLRMTNMDDFGMHYARTLNEWHKSFKNNIQEVKAQGFSDEFIRMWAYYFSYCEGGFKEQVISVSQLHLVKPMARVPMSLVALET